MRLVLLTALSLLTLSSPAHADPATIAAVATWVSTNWVVVAQVAVAVSSVVIGAQQRRRMMQSQRDELNSKLQDRTVTRIATEAPFRYVYGRARVGSDIVAMFKGGDKDQYKYLVCVHAAHECDAIEEVYIAGKLVNLDVNGFATDGDYYKTETKSAMEAKTGTTFTLAHTPNTGTLTVVTPPASSDTGSQAVSFTLVGSTVTIPAGYGQVYCNYQYTEVTSRVVVKKHLGTPTDPADAMLLAEVADKWTSTSVLRGFCYTVVKLDLNQAEFQGGPPSIEVVLRGKKLYDFRTGVTAWSQNVMLAIYDYLVGEICGVDPADLPMSQFVAAANACDDNVPSVGKRFTINGAITSDEPQSQVLEKMAQAMAGGIVATTWDVYAGKYVAPVMALDQSDVVGSIAITPGVSDSDLYNGVKGQYIGDVAINKWVAQDFKPYKNSVYATADGKEKWTNIDFPFTDALQRIHNLCRIYIEDQRNGLTVNVEFSLKAWPVKVGQRITFTSSFFGWTSKVFRVMDRNLRPGGMVKLTIKEDDPSIWDAADATLVDATPNTNLPNPYAIAPLASITCTSGDSTLLLTADGNIISRMLVTWPQATTQAVYTQGLIELEWRAMDSDVWAKAQVTGSETKAYISPVEDDLHYVVRARTVNPYMNTKSDWIYVSHQVQGKNFPPPNVTGFTVTVKSDGTRQFSFGTTNQPLDVRSGGGYVIKYRTAGSGTAWSAMTELHAGLLTQSPYETSNPVAGTYDFAIVARDSSGNESTPAFVTSAAIGNEPVAYGTATNLLANSDWQIYTGTGTGISALYKWTMYSNLSVAPTISRHSTPWNIGRGGAWSVDASDIGSTNTTNLEQDVDVTAGIEYECSVLVNPHRCRVGLTVYWIDTSGTLFATSVIDSMTTPFGGMPATGRAETAMVTLWGKATAPTGAVRARFSLQKQATATTYANSYAFWNRAMMCVARTGVTRQTATPWIEAGVDMLHGGGLEGGSVSTTQLGTEAATKLGQVTANAVSQNVAYYSPSTSYKSDDRYIGILTMTNPTAETLTCEFSWAGRAAGSASSSGNHTYQVFLEVDGSTVMTFPWVSIPTTGVAAESAYSFQKNVSIGPGASVTIRMRSLLATSSVTASNASVTYYDVALKGALVKR